MRKLSGGIIALILAVSGFGLNKFQVTKSNCNGNYYWFKVQYYDFILCNSIANYLEYPYDDGDGFPDELSYGSDVLASYQFGCYAGELYCCALGYNREDIELVWPGKWRPKAWVIPQCVLYRD